jgi:acyl carrier protein
MSLHSDIAQFIQRRLVAPGAPATIDDDTQLIDQGLIDSLGLMELVMFLEEQTGVRVPDDEVTPDNFQTVGSIAAMVERLRG